MVGCVRLRTKWLWVQIPLQSPKCWFISFQKTPQCNVRLVDNEKSNRLNYLQFLATILYDILQPRFTATERALTRKIRENKYS